MKSNKIDVDGVTSVTKMAFEEDPSKADMATELAKACVDVTDGDRCEAIAKIFQCAHSTAKERGLTFDLM